MHCLRAVIAQKGTRALRAVKVAVATVPRQVRHEHHRHFHRAASPWCQASSSRASSAPLCIMHHRTNGIGRPSSLTACGRRSKGTRALRAVKAPSPLCHGKLVEHRQHLCQAASPQCQAGSSRASWHHHAPPHQRYWETQLPHGVRSSLTRNTGPQSGHRRRRHCATACSSRAPSAPPSSSGVATVPGKAHHER
jgi:hypothetical protein